MSYFIVETRNDHNLKKIERHIVHQREVIIGRAYGCGIIIDDPYVSREHMKITLSDEGFSICDLDSKNGTSFKKKKFNGEAKDFASGDEVKIGHTLIRVLALGHELPPTKKFKWNNHAKDLLSSAKVSAFLMVLSIALTVFYSALFETSHDYYESEIYEDALGIFFVYIGGVIGVMIGNMVSREHIKPYYVVSGFGLAFIGYLGLDFLSDFIEVRLLDVTVYLTYLTSLAAIGSAIFLIGYTYIYYGRLRLKDWGGLAVIVLIVVFWVIGDVVFPDNDEKLSPHYIATMPYDGWQPETGKSPKDFIQQTDALF